MPPSAAITTFLHLVSVVGLVLTAARLYTSGLFQRYRFFFSFLLFSAAQSGVLLTMDRRSPGYMQTWILTEPIMWFFYIAVILELYTLVLERYQGLRTVGKWALYGSVTMAVLLSVITLIPQLNSPAYQGKSKLLPYFFVIERAVVCSLWIFILLILLLLRNFPVRLSRNAVVHCALYSTYFMALTLTTLMRGLFGVGIVSMVNVATTGVTAACVLLWLVFLSERGEAVLVNASRFGPDQEQRILRKLDALNTTVLRMAKK